MLEGSVRKSAEHLRINAELVRTADSYAWSDSFDRTLSDVFKIQDEIATAVATALRITLSGGSLSREQGGTRNLEAYQLILNARHSFFQNSLESLSQARESAERAVMQLDPGYGSAWTALAFAWLNLSDHGVDSRAEACGHVREAANRAISVSSDLAAGHAALGYAYYECDWNWPAAQLEMQRGLA